LGRESYSEPGAVEKDSLLKTGMSQQRFCSTLGISLGTLRHWEQGEDVPLPASSVEIVIGAA